MQVLGANSSFLAIPAPCDARTTPERPHILRWFAPLVAALHATRRNEAKRALAHHWNLVEHDPEKCVAVFGKDHAQKMS